MGAVWFAQSGSCNINLEALWNSKSNGTGDDLIWANLAADDVLCANGQSDIAINCDFTCGMLSTAAEVGAGEGNVGAAGGGFIVSGEGNWNVTALIKSGTTSCMVTSHTGLLLLEGGVTGGSAASAYGLHNTAGGSIEISGSGIGGSADNAHAIRADSTGPVTVVGNITGGSGTNARGIYVAADAPIVVMGNVAGGSNSNAHGIYNWQGAIVINGIVYGGTNQSAHGVHGPSIAAGSITIVGKIVFTAGTTSPIAGCGIRYQPGATDYIQIPYDAVATTKCPRALTADQIKSGVVSGDVTGTYRGYGGVVAPPVR